MQRPGFAVAGDRAVDQARIERRESLVVDAEALGHAGPEVVHEHVRRLDQPQQRFAAFGTLEIEHDAQLAAIDAEERAILRLQRRRILAQVVAARRLDLDDVRALVGEQRAAVRPAM